MSTTPHILVVRESNTVNPGLDGYISKSDIGHSSCYSCQDALQAVAQSSPSIVVVDAPTSTPPGGLESFDRLLEALDTQGVACLVISQGDASHSIPEWVQVLRQDVSEAELCGRVASILHYLKIVRQAQLEMRYMQRLGRHLNKQFAEVDQDMRLASRLQREFLPRDLPEVPNIVFSVLYRPASWVSGDIYDIARVDERHVCIYVADAVGHGVAASLLTMFVKQAMFSKEILNGNYRLLSPSETLHKLNEALASEKLNNSQFVTASYCLINHETLELEYARGGHPYPILVEPDGSMHELKTEGGLLGLFPGQEFPTRKMSLSPGQKLIIYSDGMEVAFVEERDYTTGIPRYQREFRKVTHLPAEELTREMERMMDDEEGSLNPQDDVTMIVVEVRAP